ARDENERSLLVKILDSAARSTSAPDWVRALISAENVTSSARAIFHSTLIVGALWPSSIWPSIARDTPEIWASRSSDRPRRVRSRRRLAPTTGARSADSEAACAVGAPSGRALLASFSARGAIVDSGAFFFTGEDSGREYTATWYRTGDRRHRPGQGRYSSF